MVPSGVALLHVVAVGGKGYSTSGGFGAVATADLPVSPGEVLYVEVGGNGGLFTGGFNGGGQGGYSGYGGGGGGASDVRTIPASRSDSLASRLVVAGAGGGQSGSGTPGGDAGQPGGGGGAGGGGGTSSAGGTSNGGYPGARGQGGNGGPGNNPGGGGGGGLSGCGGGAAAPQAGTGNGTGPGGGGGGGSSGFGPSALNASVRTDTTGVPTVTFSYVAYSFQLSSPIVTGGGAINLALSVPAAGRVKAVGTARVPSKVRHPGTHARVSRLPYGSAHQSTGKPGPLTLRIKPTRADRHLLSQGARLTVTIVVTFTSTTGTTDTKTVRVIVGGPQKHHR